MFSREKRVYFVQCNEDLARAGVSGLVCLLVRIPSMLIPRMTFFTSFCCSYSSMSSQYIFSLNSGSFATVTAELTV